MVGTSCVWEVQVERFKEKIKGKQSFIINNKWGMKNLTANVTSANEKVISRGFYFPTRTINYSDKLTEEELQTSLLAIGVSGSQQL